MASIPSDDQIIRLLSIGRSLAVHANTQARTISATPQVNTPAALFEIRNLDG